ncbi:MAG: hypothetical protein KDD49_09955 [Bacteroidetes bacterium]|nr:hypothetical protein [Bacteroidota bacterium]
MKYLLLVLFIFSNNIVAIIAQQDTSAFIDSIDNIVGRSYRDTLNESDYVFVANIVENFTQDSCGNTLRNYIESHLISNSITGELVKELMEKNLCIPEILDQISYQKLQTESNKRPWESMDFLPIYKVIYENKNLQDTVVQYFAHSNYLNDCSFLLQNNKLKTTLISKIVYENSQVLDTKYTHKEVDCENANYILLKEIFPELKKVFPEVQPFLYR